MDRRRIVFTTAIHARERGGVAALQSGREAAMLSAVVNALLAAGRAEPFEQLLVGDLLGIERHLDRFGVAGAV